jgi:predicted small lipoprotein YifL
MIMLCDRAGRRGLAGVESGGAPVALNDRRFLSMALVLGLAATVALSACGRKGPLEAPPYASTAVAGDPVDEGGEATPPKPDKDFILDPLLD